MTKLRNKYQLVRNSRNRKMILVKRLSSTDEVLDEQIVENAELEDKDMEEIANDLPVADETNVSISEEPNGDEVLEIPAGTELTEDTTLEDHLEQNCGYNKRNSKFKGLVPLRIKRNSRTKFTVRNTDGTTDEIEDPELADASIDEIASQLPAKEVTVIDDDTLEVKPEDLEVASNSDDSYGCERMSKQNSRRRRVIKIRK